MSQLGMAETAGKLLYLFHQAVIDNMVERPRISGGIVQGPLRATKR